jgi:hypothetical protein
LEHGGTEPRDFLRHGRIVIGGTYFPFGPRGFTVSGRHTGPAPQLARGLASADDPAKDRPTNVGDPLSLRPGVEQRVRHLYLAWSFPRSA